MRFVTRCIFIKCSAFSPIDSLMIHDIPHLQGGYSLWSGRVILFESQALIALRFHVYTCSHFPLE